MTRAVVILTAGRRAAAVPAPTERENLVRLTIDGDRVAGEERLLQDLGERIRDVKQAPDGSLYLLTDSSRGRILKLAPK
jgi:glucose/arabinose dehydrogenase